MSNVDCLSVDDANAAFDVLVEECGAREDLRGDFIGYLTRPLDIGTHEFRFSGALGFGGKCYLDGRPRSLRVSCYPEDRSVERDAMVDRANSRLSGLLG
jgi:hypothetical protein